MQEAQRETILLNIATIKHLRRASDRRDADVTGSPIKLILIVLIAIGLLGGIACAINLLASGR